MLLLNLLNSKLRYSGKIGHVSLPLKRSFQIDTYEELDLIIAQIKDSDFDQSVIVNFILSSESSEKEAVIDEETLDLEEDEKECLPDCQCDCE